MDDKQMIIKRIRDCNNCKFRPETSRVCSGYENCYMVSEYICKLRNQLKCKEQECEELKAKNQKLKEEIDNLITEIAGIDI